MSEYPVSAYGYDGKIHPERPTPWEWRAFRMGQARKLGTHTKQEWIELRDSVGCCRGCGATDRALTKDHIVSVFRGGCDCIQNIQPLCSSCNSSKGTKAA